MKKLRTRARGPPTRPLSKRSLFEQSVRVSTSGWAQTMMVEVNGGTVGESADLNKPPQGSRVSVYMATKSERSKRNRPGYQMGIDRNGLWGECRDSAGNVTKCAMYAQRSNVFEAWWNSRRG